jgi:hypothetical protein
LVRRVSLSDISLIAPAAPGAFLLSAVDEALIARTFAGRCAQSVRIDQELVAMSVADLAAAISQGVPVDASESRTAVNDRMGARSQFAGLWAIAAVLLVLLFLTGPIADLARRLDRAGIELRIAAVKYHLVDGFDAAGVTEKTSRERFHPTVGAAVRDATAAA